MRNPLLPAGLVICFAALSWCFYQDCLKPQADSRPAPRPVLPEPVPQPSPSPDKPKPKPRPWDAKVAGTVAPDGVTEIECDLPGNLHQQNKGGSDGAGLCVYASAKHTGHWQNDPLFVAIFDWMRKHPGGSYPEKFDRTLKQCAKELGLEVPAYLQITNSKDLAPLKLACSSGRMVMITYSRSPTGRYGGSRISHMVNLSHCDDKWAAVLDNNYPGDDRYEWMDPEKELIGVANPSGFWAVVLLLPPPPPVPINP